MEKKNSKLPSIIDFVNNTPSTSYDGDKNPYINKEIQNNLTFESEDFKFFFRFINLPTRSIKTIKLILGEACRLPGALGGYHGDYKGGLFDHILLVTNFTHQLCQLIKDLIKHPKIVLTAIYHDFAKVQYYARKLNVPKVKIKMSWRDLGAVHNDIERNLGYQGRDYHVEGAIAILNKYNLPYDEEIEKAIIFHHGSWAKYRPLEMNRAATLLHLADMMASHLLSV